jgi:hypothetical protein
MLQVYSLGYLSSLLYVGLVDGLYVTLLCHMYVVHGVHVCMFLFCGFVYYVAAGVNAVSSIIPLLVHDIFW